MGILNLRRMKRFLNSRIKHTTTALVLIAWLFALASGIANACLLEEARGTHSHAAGIEKSPHTHAATELPEQTTDSEGDTDQSPAAKALCLDACDDRTHALPKQDASLDQPQLAPVTVIAIVWLATQPIESVVRLERDNHVGPFDVPIRVRYSRLTL